MYPTSVSTKNYYLATHVGLKTSTQNIGTLSTKSLTEQHEGTSGTPSKTTAAILEKDINFYQGI